MTELATKDRLVLEVGDICFQRTSVFSENSATFHQAVLNYMSVKKIH